MLSNFDMVGRLLVAALLGSIIGFERERLVWAAGMRTHMLVCVGSCLLMIVSAFGFADILGRPNVTLDPSRVAAQVVSGIGFLGAGTILLRGEVVKGLTTAASLWAVAAIGLASGGGLYVPAIAATAIVLGILAGMKPIEERYRERRQKHDLRIVAQHGVLTIETLRDLAGPCASKLRQIVIRQRAGEAADEIALCLVHVDRTAVDALTGRLRRHEAVESVETVHRETVGRASET
ncbi:MgtC/SapB family protein [Methylobacterium sp. J-090]|uniref:MgtC/SapB family protein n=1 Tax=Methylobacterium sp. J-090 TaxID=2836666 RepID=UPI001FBBD61A|nr:MgtC/SapB family protein [Methylobacterium sp. J-090]MCJ2082965.1 MgtC/SapB family protein [Methylobacterium sp. J-090]